MEKNLKAVVSLPEGNHAIASRRQKMEIKSLAPVSHGVPMRRELNQHETGLLKVPLLWVTAVNCCDGDSSGNNSRAEY